MPTSCLAALMHPRNRLHLLAAIAALGAVVMAVGTAVASWIVPGLDPIADTISDAAAGRYQFVQDLSIHAHAIGIVALALAFWHLPVASRRWTAGVAGLLLIAALMVVIAARDEYGDRDRGGVIIHIYLVYVLGAAYAATPFLLARDITLLGPTYRLTSLAFGGLWIATAPVFFFLPTAYDGIYERALLGLGVLWIVILSYGTWRYASKPPSANRVADPNRGGTVVPDVSAR